MSLKVVVAIFPRNDIFFGTLCIIRLDYLSAAPVHRGAVPEVHPAAVVPRVRALQPVDAQLRGAHRVAEGGAGAEHLVFGPGCYKSTYYISILCRLVYLQFYIKSIDMYYYPLTSASL